MDIDTVDLGRIRRSDGPGDRISLNDLAKPLAFKTIYDAYTESLS